MVDDAGVEYVRLVGKKKQKNKKPAVAVSSPGLAVFMGFYGLSCQL